ITCGRSTEGSLVMPEYDSMVVKSLRKIENATRELLKLDQILQEICAEVQSFKDFNFVAIQLKNKEDQTIETVYGTESRSEWFGLAKHTIQGRLIPLSQVHQHIGVAGEI